MREESVDDFLGLLQEQRGLRVMHFLADYLVSLAEGVFIIVDLLQECVPGAPLAPGDVCLYLSAAFVVLCFEFPDGVLV